MKPIKYQKQALFMDTIVSITVYTDALADTVEEQITQAFSFFRLVEETCSRFDSNSELRKLSLTVGKSVKVSELLFQILQFAIEMAQITEGALDPTLGYVLTEAGFSKNYLTKETVEIPLLITKKATYQNVLLDASNRTVTLTTPLLLDLGAVAKGFAVDLASHALSHFNHFVVDAGGDLFVKGYNELGVPWNIGIQHPMDKKQLVMTVSAESMAICTSGSYERKSKTKKNIHHLMNPTTKQSGNKMISSTVIAPYAMLADAMSTALFVMGEERGFPLLESMECEAMTLKKDLAMLKTSNFGRYMNEVT